jgi:hypothetical protein
MIPRRTCPYECVFSIAMDKEYPKPHIMYAGLEALIIKSNPYIFDEGENGDTALLALCIIDARGVENLNRAFNLAKVLLKHGGNPDTVGTCGHSPKDISLKIFLETTSPPIRKS